MNFQRELARNGEAILKIDGLALVSTFDPSKEAAAWALKSVTEIGTHTSVIMIGGGCGYHVKALKNLRPELSVAVIEQNEAVAAFIGDVHPEIKDVIVAETALELTQSMRLRDFLAGRFATLSHPAQAQMRPEWNASIARFLTARDPLSFLMQLRMRPELYSLFEADKILKLDPNAPLSILTVRSLFKDDAKSSRERRIWRVLEELIV